MSNCHRKPSTALSTHAGPWSSAPVCPARGRMLRNFGQGFGSITIKILKICQNFNNNQNFENLSKL